MQIIIQCEKIVWQSNKKFEQAGAELCPFKDLSKSSFDHEILHLPTTCILNKTINVIFYLFWGGGELKISNCKKKKIRALRAPPP